MKKILAYPFIWINDKIADIMFESITMDTGIDLPLWMEQMYWNVYIHCVLVNDEWEEWINK